MNEISEYSLSLLEDRNRIIIKDFNTLDLVSVLGTKNRFYASHREILSVNINRDTVHILHQDEFVSVSPSFVTRQRDLKFPYSVVLQDGALIAHHHNRLIYTKGDKRLELSLNICPYTPTVSNVQSYGESRFFTLTWPITVDLWDVKLRKRTLCSSSIRPMYLNLYMVRNRVIVIYNVSGKWIIEKWKHNVLISRVIQKKFPFVTREGNIMDYYQGYISIIHMQHTIICDNLAVWIMREKREDVLAYAGFSSDRKIIYPMILFRHQNLMILSMLHILFNLTRNLINMIHRYIPQL